MPVATVQEKFSRCTDHFSELLNRLTPEDPSHVPPAETLIPINIDKPTRKDIRKTIEKLKNGKASDPDNRSAEALKADLNTTTKILFSLFEKIWEEKNFLTS